MNTIAKALAALSMTMLAACGGSSGVWDEIEKQERVSKQEAARILAESQAFLEANKAKPGVKITESGLQYQVMRAGDDSLPTPGPHDTVTVQYQGELPDGRIFDSTYVNDEPATFNVARVIPGWREAMQMMHPGDALRLVVPPELGYGEFGQPPDIPPNQVLIFKVELVSFTRADGRTVRAAAP